MNANLTTTAHRPFTLRPAASHDAEALAELAARLFRDAFGGENTPEDMALYLAESFSGELQAEEIVDPLMHTVIACDERGAMIGYAQLREQPPAIPLDADRPIELARIYVDREWQGREVAGALVDAMDAEARRREGDVLWLGVWERNPRAIAFYRKCGFALVGQQNFVVGTDVQRDLVMTRPLRVAAWGVVALASAAARSRSDMPAYLVAEITVTDHDAYERYKRLVPSSIAAFGGRYLARGGTAESLEGDWNPTRLVILEFPSVERARAWWASQEYAPAKAIRLDSARSRIVLLEGVPAKEPSLHAAFVELQREITATRARDAETQALLERVSKDIGPLITRGSAGPLHAQPTLRTQLSEAVVRVEATHPQLAHTLENVLNMLALYNL